MAAALRAKFFSILRSVLRPQISFVAEDRDCPHTGRIPVQARRLNIGRALHDDVQFDEYKSPPTRAG